MTEWWYIRFGLRQQELTHHGDASGYASVPFLPRQRLWWCWFVGNRASCNPQRVVEHIYEVWKITLFAWGTVWSQHLLLKLLIHCTIFEYQPISAVEEEVCFVSVRLMVDSQLYLKILSIYLNKYCFTPALRIASLTQYSPRAATGVGH